MMTHCKKTTSPAMKELLRGSRVPAGVRVMVVDDDPNSLHLVAATLQWNNYIAVPFNNPAVACSAVLTNREAFDVILTEVFMGGMDGFSLLKILLQEGVQVPVIMMSSYADLNVVIGGLRNGARLFLRKPLDPTSIETLWQVIVRKNQGLGQCKNEQTSTNKKNNNNNNNKVVVPKVGTRVIWNPYLNSKFQEAINRIGFENAAPTNVLEAMNCPGLTVRNIASHLQNYRREKRDEPALKKVKRGRCSRDGKSVAGAVLLSDTSADIPETKYSSPVRTVESGSYSKGMISTTTTPSLGINSSGHDHDNHNGLQQSLHQTNQELWLDLEPSCSDQLQGMVLVQQSVEEANPADKQHANHFLPLREFKPAEQCYQGDDEGLEMLLEMMYEDADDGVTNLMTPSEMGFGQEL